ncbi:MAG: histidinol dehydrogenase, partial [Aerococcus viridans]
MDVASFRAIIKAQKAAGLDVERMLAVQNIINDVRSQGDAAVVDYTNRFDGQNYTNAEAFRVSPDRLKASWDELSPELQASLKTTKARIEAYEQSILYQDMIGEEISYVYHPLEVAGFYIPGGQALYPSTVLMTIVPAIVAGVTNFVVTTPVFAETSITFAALYLCGVTDNVFAIGGAQAIAAMAYGTETIPNGDVAIDAIAGPSEILLYVDDSIPVDAIVYDIFAQAEHDQAARTYLLCESQSFADKITARIKELLPLQSRYEIIEQSITDNHYSIVDTRSNLLAILNQIAPEHVSIQHRDQDAIVDQVQYAGAVFKGYYAMEAIGDYVAGPSHVLPTGGTARFSQGLTANDFRTANAVINIKKATYDQIATAGELLAEA